MATKPNCTLIRCDSMPAIQTINIPPTQFIAASNDRVYVADRLGRILVLAADTGARLDRIPAEGLPIKLRNAQNDRIYLATEAGLIQCLREIELSEPLQHVTFEAAEAEPAAKPGEKQPPPEDPFKPQEPAPAESPFAPQQDDNPFQ